jgi:hypothetical protein
MKRSLILLAGFLVFLIPNEAIAQSEDHQEVQAVIEQFFDGMRESDSTKVAETFIEDAIMKTVGKNERGEVIVNSGNLGGFLRAVGSPKEQIWDEKIQGYDIKVDGELATVWTPYQFYVGDNFSHCGVNSFQLVQKGEGWKIFFIVDTRRPTNCVETK